jgi:hypothetical protein
MNKIFIGKNKDLLIIKHQLNIINMQINEKKYNKV